MRGKRGKRREKKGKRKEKRKEREKKERFSCVFLIIEIYIHVT